MDNKAHEKYVAEHPVKNVLYTTVDPYDGEITYAEYGIFFVIGLLLLMALWKIIIK
jgi:hypothetical protein